jgi:hypothetical protein
MRKPRGARQLKRVGVSAATTRWIVCLGLLFAHVVELRSARDSDSQTGGMPSNLAVFLVRHAEKPDNGSELAPEGSARAQKYVEYFQNQVRYNGQPIRWNYLFASAESAKSDRPFLTIQPLSEAIGVQIDSDFKNKHFNSLVDELKQNKGNKFDNANVLICWHHGEILDLASALGANRADLPQSAHWPGKWPKKAYGWLLKIYYKPDGTLDREHTEAVNEHLMPDDTLSPGQ